MRSTRRRVARARFGNRVLRGQERLQRAWWAALFALALMAGLTLPGTSSAKLPSRFYGVDAPGFQQLTSRDVQLMAAGNVRVVRFQISWAAIEPRRHGGFEWSALDAQVRRLVSHGLEPLPFVESTPRWVAKNQFIPPSASARGSRGWRRFLDAMVRRYGPNGSFWQEHPGLAKTPIRSWQIWNEPNFSESWKPRPKPKAYLKLLRISAAAIRRVDPGANIVLAGLGPGLGGGKKRIPSWRFLDGIYRAGGKRFFDTAADQPYAPSLGGVADQLKRFVGVMRRHHDRRTPIWITEVGWSSGHLKNFGLAVGPRRQAKLLRRTFAYIGGRAKRLGVTRLLWYSWRDPGSRSQARCKTCLDFGLRKHNLKAKPAWGAFERFAR